MVRAKTKKTEKKLLYIEWADATTEDGWGSEDTLETPIVKSVGFFVAETARDLVISGDWSDPETNRRLAIPKAWVQKKKEIVL
jgi:hypothetical protein